MALRSQRADRAELWREGGKIGKKRQGEAKREGKGFLGVGGLRREYAKLSSA